MTNYNLKAVVIAIWALLPGPSVAIDIVKPYNPPGDTPSPQQFDVCYKYTCQEISELSITTTQWEEIRSIFQPAAASSSEERQLIAKAVARMEQIVGEKIDTSNDKGGNLQGLSIGGNQMDCVDESTNTTTYLRMMELDGLLRWHRVEDRKTRGFLLFGGWPHTTAVISERQNKKKRWAVDSWFFDNGVPPAILPLDKWSDGWKPPGFKG